MKNIFRAITVFLTMVAGLNQMNAQSLERNLNSPNEVAKKQLLELTETLNLTTDQQKYIYRAILAKGSNSRRYLSGNASNGLSISENKERIENNFIFTMKRRLTPDQYAIWERQYNKEQK